MGQSCELGACYDNTTRDGNGNVLTLNEVQAYMTTTRQDETVRSHYNQTITLNKRTSDVALSSYRFIAHNRNTSHPEQESYRLR